MKAALFLALLLPVLVSAADPAEIKLLIACDKLADAKKILEVKTDTPADVRVCFFDTSKTLLDASKVIVRARLEAKADGKKDVTVKLRGAKTPPAGFESLKSEADWVGPNLLKDVKPSFEVKQEDLNETPLKEVLDGKLNVGEILSDEQKKFAQACLDAGQPALAWGDMRRYGEIQVWKSKHTVGKLKKKVTVELWRLERPEKGDLELLEISVKTEKDDPRSVSEIAAEFYQEALDAGLGEATGASKTQKVIEYYKPGK